MIRDEVWEPVEGISKEYYFVSLINSSDAIELLLKHADDEKTILIVFERVICYRYIDEGRRYRTISELVKHSDSAIYSQNRFFKILNSEYLTFIVQQASRAFSANDGMHYAFFDSEGFIDIITFTKPNIFFCANS